MREIDEDDRREAIDQRRASRRGTTCLCGNPDWPGSCPGPDNCPVHGEPNNKQFCYPSHRAPTVDQVGVSASLIGCASLRKPNT